MSKQPLSSRKLIAYLLADMGWTALIGYGIWLQGDAKGSVLLAMVVVKGFVETGYILGQSYVDRFVQLAEVVTHQVPPSTPPALDPVPPPTTTT